MANTNTDLIRDQLMEAYENCVSKQLFLTDVDRSLFLDHVNDLIESLDVIVDQFDVEEEDDGDAHLQEIDRLAWR